LISFGLPFLASVPFFSEANGYKFTFFSHFFFIANFCLFCRKGKSSVVTAQPFFSAFLGYSSLHLVRFGAKINFAYQIFFCRKGKSSVVTAQHLFLLFLVIPLST